MIYLFFIKENIVKMCLYNFYYDESEHSRKINYKTITAENYYDNFVSMIVGWSIDREDVVKRHNDFEVKYANRKDSNGEIKSSVLKQKQFKYGFASLNNQNTQFLNDFFHFLMKIFIFIFLFLVR